MYFEGYCHSSLFQCKWYMSMKMGVFFKIVYFPILESSVTVTVEETGTGGSILRLSRKHLLK
jgi:hypothetical protein